MSQHERRGSAGGSDAPVKQERRRVELARLQPVEAEVIAARLRAAGIDATIGPTSVYESVDFSEGVPVLVFESDAAAASALVNQDGSQEQQA